MRPKIGCTSSATLRYCRKPPGAMVISKTVSMDRTQVPKRSKRNLRESWSLSGSSMKGLKTCERKMAPISSSTKSSVMDHARAPTEAATALTSTRSDLNAFMTRTTRKTLESRTRRTRRRIATFPTPLLPLDFIIGVITHESAEETMTISASPAFAQFFRYFLPSAAKRVDSSTRNRVVKTCSMTTKLSSTHGQDQSDSQGGFSQRMYCLSSLLPRYSSSRDMKRVLATMRTPTRRSKLAEWTHLIHRGSPFPSSSFPDGSLPHCSVMETTEDPFLICS
mmetsp:Transcript_77457/g.167519  ORF Transcript_77457/g.167519 Transcript_77457/m.167519 type:complete len:279 (-) Transcript_77457:495-1331(-)